MTSEDQRRVALIVATDSYTSSDLGLLGAPFHDANALAEALRDPDLGDFNDVEVVHNLPSHEVLGRIENTFTRARRNDTVLLYISGHGVRDRNGELHLATIDTETDRLISTALPARVLHAVMENGPRGQIVVLDCCYSGAFVKGMVAKGVEAGVRDALEPTTSPVQSGRGQVIMTATNRVQYALESQDDENGTASVYTRLLVDGIRSGLADADGDGLIGTGELHDYVSSRMAEANHPQQPQRWSFGVAGDLVVARAGSAEPIALRGFPADTAPRRRTRAWVRSAVVAVMVALAVVSGILWLNGRTSGSSAMAEPGAYLLTVRGSAADGAPFDLQGELRIYPAGPDAQQRICLKVGDPFGTPSPGAIWFGTTSECFGTGGDSWFAAAVVEGELTVISPSASEPTSNDLPVGFTVSEGVSACWFVPHDGDVRLRTSDGQASGAINLRGLNACGSTAQGIYTASFEASMVSADPNEIVSLPRSPRTSGDVSSDVSGTRYVVASVISFENLVGTDDSVDTAATRFAGAVMKIDTNALTFEYAPPDSRTDVFPVTGALVDGGGGIYVASGQREAGDGVTFARAVVGGTIDLSGEEATVDLELRTYTPTAESGYRAQAVLLEG